MPANPAGTPGEAELRGLVEKWRNEVGDRDEDGWCCSYTRGRCADELEAALVAASAVHSAEEKVVLVAGVCTQCGLDVNNYLATLPRENWQPSAVIVARLDSLEPEPDDAGTSITDRAYRDGCRYVIRELRHTIKPVPVSHAETPKETP